MAQILNCNYQKVDSLKFRGWSGLRIPNILELGCVRHLFGALTRERLPLRQLPKSSRPAPLQDTSKALRGPRCTVRSPRPPDPSDGPASLLGIFHILLFHIHSPRRAGQKFQRGRVTFPFPRCATRHPRAATPNGPHDSNSPTSARNPEGTLSPAPWRAGPAVTRKSRKEEARPCSNTSRWLSSSVLLASVSFVSPCLGLKRSDGAGLVFLPGGSWVFSRFWNGLRRAEFSSLQGSEVTQSCPTLCDPMDWLFHPRDSPDKNTGVGCRFLLQGIFSTQGLNPGLPHCR